MLGLHDLHYFKAAATSVSLRQAARSLLITQPALTHVVQRLEAHFGHVLFERRRTGVRLTVAGARLLAQVEPLIAQWEALGQDLSSADLQLKGRITLGCHPSVGQYALAMFLPGLLRKYPELDVRLVHDLSRAITDGVNAGPIDLGIVVNPFSYPDIVIRPLLEDHVGFWAKARVNEGVLICDPNLVQTQWLLRKIGKKTFRRVIESANLDVIKALAEAGVGTAILPARVAQLAKGLRRVEHLSTPYVDRVCLVYRPAFAKSFLGRTVIDAVTAIRARG